MEIYFFGHFSEIGQILPKLFAPQNVQHTAKLRFSGVLKFFLMKIDIKGQLCVFAVNCQKYHLVIFFFLYEFENRQSQRKDFDLMEMIFGQTNEMGQIFFKSFAPQNMQHTAKLFISGIWKHLRWKLRNFSLSPKKVDISEEAKN